ncbi:MAG: YitT family protein [Mycoplasmatales bacterium]
MGMNLKELKRAIGSPKIIFLIILGAFVNAIGLSLLPHWELFPTGTTGIAFEISSILDKISGIALQPNMLYFWLNIPLIIFGYFKVGKVFTIRTLMSIVCLTFFMGLWPASIIILDDKLLSIVLAGILCGTGIGLSLNAASSTGGTDIIALFMSIEKGKSFGTFNLLFNMVVIVIAVGITHELETAIYMVIFIYVMGIIIDKVHNANQKYTLIITTTHAEAIMNKIYSDGIIRGVTVIDSQGGYSKKNNNTLLITCERNDYLHLTRIIKVEDDQVFISTLSTASVIGTFENTFSKNLK